MDSKYSIETLSEIAFNAYSEKADWKTYDNKRIPSWDEIGITIQLRWFASTTAIIEAFNSGNK